MLAWSHFQIALPARKRNLDDLDEKSAMRKFIYVFFTIVVDFQRAPEHRNPKQRLPGCRLP